ncbi:proline-rich protein HaeIII subfamily 1-like [Cervus canadensis]|uniref:proline-rich protein HaeIII subfamily 1-like n=1 Tax=Cervus canadensis TaxID=1574408 RepID=UPI001C9E201F|nr:proline-rich protein HaeIII subfamily 1-like [Cervus canadensis]
MSAGRGTQWNERGRAKQPRVCRERGGGEAPGTSMSRLNISLYYCVALLPSLPAGPGRQGTGAPWVPWGRSGVVRSPLWRDLGSARVRPQNGKSLGWKRNPSSDLGRPPWWKPIRSERAGAPAPLEWLQSRTQRTSAPPTLWPLPDIRRSDCVSEIPGAPRNYLPRNLWLARLPPGIKDTDCATPAVCGRRGPQRAPGSSHSLHSEFSLKGEGQSWGGGAEERAPRAEDPAVGARPRATQVAEEPRRARRPPPPAGPLRAPVLPAARRRRKRRGRPTPAGSCARRPRPAPHRPPGSPPLAPRTVGSGGEKREQPCLPPAPSTFFVVVVAFPRWLNVT